MSRIAKMSIGENSLVGDGENLAGGAVWANVLALVVAPPLIFLVKHPEILGVCAFAVALRADHESVSGGAALVRRRKCSSRAAFDATQPAPVLPAGIRPRSSR